METPTTQPRETRTPETVRARCPKCQEIIYPKLAGAEAGRLQCPHCHRKFHRDQLEVLE
jgi:transposase